MALSCRSQFQAVQLTLFLFGQRFHIEVTMGLQPTFMDLDRERPDKPQATLRVRKDPNDMGPALEFLIEPFEHIGAFEVFMMFLGQSVKSEGFLDISFYPFA
jgi:hypothetical protein